MPTKQSIAVIGASGSMGKAISKALAGTENRILLYSRDQQKAQQLADEIRQKKPGAEVDFTDGSTDACWEADIIILAVPYEAEKNLAEKIREVSNQKVVVSISNPLNQDFSDVVTPPDSSAAEELQKLLPHVKLVKAFNTSFAANFKNPQLGGIRADVFVAGDDVEAVNAVSALVSQAGFRPVYAGGLSVSGTLEKMQLLLIQIGLRNNYDWQAGWKILHN